MGWLRGFEPPTTGITIQYSNQLSYSHHRETFGATLGCWGTALEAPLPAGDWRPRTRTEL